MCNPPLAGLWEPFSFRLLSNRNIEFEKLSPPQYAGEIQARVAQSLNLLEDRGEQVLAIQTASLAHRLAPLPPRVRRPPRAT